MSKKNLLNESQVRQFMKLAKLEPLANGFVEGLRENFDDEAIEELRTGRTGALGPKDGTMNPGHGRGQGEAANGSLFEEEESIEGELDYAEDDLADDSLEGDEEAAVDIERADDEQEVDTDRTVSVDDFLAALESALEDVMGDEVEIDTDEMEDEEDEEGEMDVELAPGGDEDVDIEDEMELQENDEEELTEEEGSKWAQQPEFLRRGKKGKVGKRAGVEGGGKYGKGGHYKTGKDESVVATDDLVEQITKRVAARILKSALTKK